MTQALPSPLSRADQIDALKNTHYDVLVIGGGATGAGCALDAAARGLNVAMIDKADFASGTSSKSTKLIHGGVRYLEQAFKSFDMGHLALVKEALAERKTLLHIAPHLSSALPLLIPLYKRWHIPYYYAGLVCYDLLAGFRGIGRSYYKSTEKIKRDFPTLKFDGMKGGIVYYDGQFNDSRMNVEIALTARQHGATIANYLTVIELLKENDHVSGARVTDSYNNESFDIKADCVINATGPHTDIIRILDDAQAVPMVRASAGTHIVVKPGVAPDNLGMLIPQTSDGRVVFILPWEGATVIGTTDAEAPLSDDPQAQEKDIQFLIDETNAYLSQKLTRDDVLSAWTGLRPLVSAPDESTAKLSRSHVIHTSKSGLVTITGGKWTTYRNMAQDTVDEALKQLSVDATPCNTEHIKLVGAQGYGEAAHKLRNNTKLDEDIVEHLLHNYGSRVSIILSIALDMENGIERLSKHHPYIQAEVVYAVRYEMAHTIKDVLHRRTRLHFVDSKASDNAVSIVADIMEKELQWTEEEKKHAILNA